jgi:hypothetical protein
MAHSFVIAAECLATKTKTKRREIWIRQFGGCQTHTNKVRKRKMMAKMLEDRLRHKTIDKKSTS